MAVARCVGKERLATGMTDNYANDAACSSAASYTLAYGLTAHTLVDIAVVIVIQGDGA